MHPRKITDLKLLYSRTSPSGESNTFQTYFRNRVCMCCCCLVTSLVQLFCHPMDCSLPAFSVHGILRQEYGRELPFPSPGDLPDPGIESKVSCVGRQILYHWATGKPRVFFSSVQFSRSVVSDSLWPHDSQHTRPPCPLPTPRVHSDSHPSSLWCHPAISSSVVTFSSCPNPSQHQSLFQWVNFSHEVAKVLEFQL